MNGGALAYRSMYLAAMMRMGSAFAAMLGQQLAEFAGKAGIAFEFEFESIKMLVAGSCASLLGRFEKFPRKPRMPRPSKISFRAG